MTKWQERQIREAVKVIRRLSTLETARFHMHEGKDEEIKEAIRAWAGTWFPIEAQKIEDALNNLRRF